MELKKSATTLLLLIMAFVALQACAPAVTPPTATPEAKATTAAAPAQGKWESVLAEAKKEGSVSIYAIWRPDTRNAVSQAFKDKYGISVEFSPFARGGELMAKVKAEQRAGLYLADIFGVGPGSFFELMKPEGVLGPVEQLFILPEVTEPRNWRNDRFPFLDKDRTIVGMISLLQRFVAYNRDLVKAGEIKNYGDLLKPAYKGKITMNDPSISGQGNGFVGHLAMHIWNPDQAKDYLRQIVVDQQAVIQRDNNLHVESVVRGKYAVALAPAADVLYRFIGLNAPIEAVVLEEGAFISTGSGAFAVPTKLAHPNATAVFVNWLLGKEGQTVFARGFGNPSLRNDVPTEGFVPISLAQPGEKIFLDSEELIVFRGQMLSAARQIIEEASRR